MTERRANNSKIKGKPHQVRQILTEDTWRETQSLALIALMTYTSDKSENGSEDNGHEGDNE